ncbi:hypothetical protein Tco_0209446 [Tanacetum coccineum]
MVTPPPINTEATTITTSLPEITPFIALQLRVARLEQEMSEVKKTDHSADSPQKLRSEKSPKEIIIIKREQGEKQQDSTYSIRSTDKVALEEFDLKSALFKHMNKNKTANRNPANYHLYHALMEALIADEDAMDKEVAVKVKDHKRKHDSDDDEDDDDDEGPSAGSNQGRSAKRRRPDSAASGSAQPPPKDDDQSSKKPRESDASASKQHPALTSTGWQITDTRDDVVNSSMPRSDTESEHSEQSSDDIPMQDEGHVSDLEDTDNAHIPKVSTTTWFKPIPEGERPATPEPEWTIPPNDFPEPETNWANTYATMYQVPVENKLQRKTYDIGSFIKWFCRRTGKKKLCKVDLEENTVDLDTPLGSSICEIYMNHSHRRTTGSEKLPLSISKLKAARYLDFGLEELVPSLWVESEREYDISAAYGITHWWFRRKEFYINKHSEPSDREQSDADVTSQSDLLLQRNYTKSLSQEARCIHRDSNDQRKLMRLNELHKFSDGTLTRVMEKLDHMVKDFHLFEYNKGMETRKWSEDDKRRSKDFITAIEKRLQIRRIFRSLESFVGGRIRDIDYRLINRTTTVTDWKGKPSLRSTERSLLHDNIVPNPDLALELGKSISLTEAEEEVVAREVHATHARIVSESEPEPTQRRQSGIAFRDSFIVSKKRSPAKQEAADIMKALKESKKMSKRQPGTGGSNEGTGPVPQFMAPDHSSSGPVLHEMTSDQIRSDLTPNRQETSVDNISSDLVSNKQKASDYDISGPTTSLGTRLQTIWPKGKDRDKQKVVYGRTKREDEVQTVIRNKAILVAKGYAQEEGTDFEDSFALVARLEAFLGDKLVSKMSKKQYCTAISSTEAQYVALSARGPFRKTTVLIRREKSVFYRVTSGALIPPHRRRDLSFMEHLKIEMEIPCSNKIKFITACSFSNDTFEDIMKAQVSIIKASATLNIQAFKIKKSVSISFRMTQVHKMAKDHMMMIRDYDWMMISKKLKNHIQVKLKPKSLKFTASDSQDIDQ